MKVSNVMHKFSVNIILHIPPQEKKFNLVTSGKRSSQEIGPPPDNYLMSSSKGFHVSSNEGNEGRNKMHKK